MIISVLVVLTSIACGNELALTFDAADSKCTAQCSTCSSSDSTDDTDDDPSVSSDAIDDLVNITSANSLSIQETLEEIMRMSSMVSSLKNTAMTTSATVNDILLLVQELVQQHNESSTESPLPTSCEDIKQRTPTSPSGEYLIQTASGGSQYVYCNMDTLMEDGRDWLTWIYQIH